MTSSQDANIGLEAAGGAIPVASVIVGAAGASELGGAIGEYGGNDIAIASILYSTINSTNPADTFATDTVQTGGQYALNYSMSTALNGLLADTTELSAGPIGAIVFAVTLVIQITMVLINMYWNPFKTYFNADLAAIKEVSDLNIKNAFKVNETNWPLEIKPNLIGPDYSAQLSQYANQYYTDNNLISSNEAITIDNAFVKSQQLSRLKKMFKTDSNGNLVLSNPIFNIISDEEQTQQEITMLMASAIAVKKGYKSNNAQQAVIDLLNYKKPWYLDILGYIKLNWVFIIIICVCLCSSSCSSIISGFN